MSAQDVLASRRKFLLSGEASHIRKRLPHPLGFALLIFLIMTALVLVFIAAARAQPAPQLLELELPQTYLPGSPMPKGVLCPTTSIEIPEKCYVRYRENQVLLKFDLSMKTIIRVTISTKKHTIGELIAAWGTPSGMVQKYYMTLVHWGARSAYVYSDSFRPDSEVKIITYDLQPQRTFPWHGFRRYRS